jgi:hypothetical protein
LPFSSLVEFDSKEAAIEFAERIQDSVNSEGGGKEMTIENLKCPECGGDVVVEDGRLECLDCSLLGLYGAAESDAKIWRLWGAAPELLKAAENVVSLHEILGDAGSMAGDEYKAMDTSDDLKALRAAIAKAKGE